VSAAGVVESLSEPIVLNRPAASWRIRCYAWSPSREWFTEFSNTRELAGWLERARAWATYGNIEFQDTECQSHVYWRRESGKDDLDESVLALVPS
jgi:hypothetical protein